jgi:hypothetical protein
VFPPMNIPPLARRALMSFPIVLSAVPALGVNVATATNSIEGVWSFNGGAVGIQSLSDGTNPTGRRHVRSRSFISTGPADATHQPSPRQISVVHSDRPR